MKRGWVTIIITSCAHRAVASRTSRALSGPLRASRRPDDHGFEITTAEVTFHGLCADCAAAKKRV